MSFDPDLRARLSRYLPAEALADLPDSAAAVRAVRRLNSLSQAINAFVPQSIADERANRPMPHTDIRPGTFLFADVSGFTLLADMLQRQMGAAGAEVLTQIMNDYFAAMLDILAKSNGRLLKFAGDALLAFFPATSGSTDAAHAIRAGLRMQRAMAAHFQPVSSPLLAELSGAEPLALTMSIGLSRGDLIEAVVGGEQQRDLILLGDLPRRAMAAESAGSCDDVLVDGSLRAVGESFGLDPAGPDVWRVRDTLGEQLGDYELAVPQRRRAQSGMLIGYGQDDLVAELRRQIDEVEHVARFVAPEVVEKLVFRGDHIESENRPAAVLFVHLAGFSDLLATWGPDRLPEIVALLDRAYTLAQHTITAHGGSLTRCDPYQAGTKLLITFGAPVAHPDDPVRAVAAALSLSQQIDPLNHDLPAEARLSVRVGISSGYVFAGEVGWRARREYTVMGDDVNLAARLMSHAAPGEVLVSARVWKRVKPRFTGVPLPLFTLPGRSDPIQAHRIQAPIIASTVELNALALPPDDARMLDRDGAAEIAAQQLGADRLDPVLADWLWTRAGTNPRYITALIRQAQNAGAVAREVGGIVVRPARLPFLPPDDVRDLITSEIDRLPPDVRDLLRLAAVCGDPVTPGLLGAVGGLRDAADTLRRLEALAEAGILEHVDERTYRFRYGLVREVAYQSLPRLQRHKLHRLAAGALLAQSEDEITLRRVADHLSRGGLPMRAIELLATAADDAEARGDTARALGLYRIAADLFPHDDSARAQIARLEREQDHP
jgi:class 3 adenylate cyclase